MDAVLIEAGLGDYCRQPYMRARGHGLGIGAVLPGDITKGSQEQLCEGDYFVLHPNQYLPTSGYLLCGEPVTVSQAGAQALTKSVGDLASVGAAPC
jgi:Xaa-Pro dipeptidase